MRDPAMALVRSLAAGAPGFELDEVASRDWVSATFAGWRHIVRCSVPDGRSSAAWMSRLPEAEHDVRGFLVADVSIAEERVIDGRVRLVIEALVIEAA